MLGISFGRVSARAFFVGDSMFEFIRFSFVCFFGVVFIAGCDSDAKIDGRVGEINKSNIQKVRNSLRLYQIRLGKAAPSEEELCDFIANNGSIEKNVARMNIDRANFKDHLISERDSEPFFVRYGIICRDKGVAHPLVFESVGVEGVRQVCWSNGDVVELSDEKEYEKLKNGKYKKEKSVDPSIEADK